MVIIISNPEDAHPGFVTKHLKNDYIILDAGDIIAKRALTYTLRKGKLEVRYNGKLLSNVTGVWVRRPRRAGRTLEFPVRDEHFDYVTDALNAHIRQLYSLFSEATWVSSNFHIARAENKVFQLETAAKLGMNIPETIVTSDPKEARSFVEQHKKVIVKPLSRYAPRLDDKVSLILWSHVITPQDSINYEGLHLAPSIFQQAIEPAYELRVTVVGDEAFAAKITVENELPNVRDWRVDQHDEAIVQMEAYSENDSLLRQCITYTQKLGLNYGALDIIVDKQGVAWFLEINPNGQWAFVEHRTGQPIGKALARLLETTQPRDHHEALHDIK
jgi:glutathione synthase/RimK-type ligase-like ATP-grasp enzyme